MTKMLDMGQTRSRTYHKRMQTKFKRRRQGKTDYYQRRKLVIQAKDKFGARKYRLVVRMTNTTIICQIVHTTTQGDHVFCSAYSRELPRYGIKHGLKNWAAAYATGLLCARRALVKLGLDDKFKGVEEADGEYVLTEQGDAEQRPFKVALDVGLRRTSTGSRVFAAMKGASDGGIFVPHSEKRFPGYDIESKELDAEVLRKYIFGGHVAEYMEVLEEDDDEKYAKQFAGLISDGITSDQLEEMYAKAHEAVGGKGCF